MKKIITFMIILSLLGGCGQAEELKNVSGELEQDNAGSSEESIVDQLERSGIKTGEIAPSLALKTLSGEIFSDESLQGKKVLINFWASWCQPCRQEMPDLVRLQKEYQDELLIIGINVQESEQDAKAFVEEYGIEFPILMDETGELSEQFQILALPTTYFLHSDRTVASKHIGFRQYDQFVQAFLELK